MKHNHMKQLPYMVEIEDINRFPSPELIENNAPFYTHISSPVQNEEILIPLTIKKSSRGSKRHKKRRHSHNTYKVYRHIKSSKPKSSRRSKRYSRRTF